MTTNVNPSSFRGALDQFIASVFSTSTTTETVSKNLRSSSSEKTDSKKEASSNSAEKKSFSFSSVVNDFFSGKSTLKDVQNNLLVGLGIKRDENGARQGVFASVVDSIADTQVGRFFGLEKSGVVDAVQKTTEVAGKAVDVAGKTGGAEVSMGAQLLEAGIGIYNYIKNYGQLDPKTRVLTGASLGASVGFTFGGPIGAGIGAVVGGISGLFKTSGKPKEQKERDQMRKMLQQGGILDDKFTIGLADGTRFDMGIDGKKREEWGGRHYFEPDPADPLAQKTFTIFKELANQMFQGNDNLVNSLAGYLTKASLSNANGDQNKVQENIKFIISQFMGQQAAATPSDASKQTQNQQNTQAVENKKPTEQVSV